MEVFARADLAFSVGACVQVRSGRKANVSKDMVVVAITQSRAVADPKGPTFVCFPVEGPPQILMKHSTDVVAVQNNVPDTASERFRLGQAMWEQKLAEPKAEEPPTEESESPGTPTTARKVLREAQPSSNRSLRRRKAAKADAPSPSQQQMLPRKKPRVEEEAPEAADDELGAMSMELEEDEAEQEHARAVTTKRPELKQQNRNIRTAAADDNYHDNVNAAIVYELGLEAGRRRQLQEDLFSLRNHDEDLQRLQLLRKKQ